ncbi:amidohydrolase family protein [Faecalicatena sp. Marseille-Q4148]|nr:amidohydrolase family protein [Faecalicatena sp. Marseille-Q4148]
MRILDTTILNEQYEIIRHKDILIADGRIQKILDTKSSTDCFRVREKTEEVIDGRHLLFLPGLIDSHMHTGQQLLRGRVLDELPMIWTRIMLPFESRLTKEKMRLSAELASLEMMKSGTSGFVEAGSYFMEEAAAVYADSGLRGVLSCSTMDQPGLPETIADTAQSAVERTDRLYEFVQEQMKENQEKTLKVYYSLRSLMSCSSELVCLVKEHASERNAWIQAHMNEYAGEVNAIVTREHLRPYEYLAKLGVLSDHFLGAHSLLVSEKEMDLLKEYEVKVCHCPFSNCGKAAPNTPGLFARGISIGLGTDGTAHGGMSLWNEMKIFRSVMNLLHGVPMAEPAIMPAKKILQMVLEGGAAALGEENSCGCLKEGYRADLIGINLDQPHIFPSGNLLNTLVESVNANDVTHMIVNGKLVMKNREVLTLDEERILYEAKEYLEKEEW